MGATVSKTCLAVFEICNEMFIAVASGLTGIFLLLHHGFVCHKFVRTIFVTSFTVGCLLYLFQCTEVIVPSVNKVVVITGCDSGLGYSLAQHSCELGFTVIAGFLKLESKGARGLKRYESKIIQIPLDVTKEENILAAVTVVKKYLKEDKSRVLWAVINNAGVMVFGEFEWLTEKLIKQQVDVNLLGTLSLTKSFCPLLRRYKARVITVTSHCALATLPGIAVYGATKAGLQAWSDGFRVEMNKYGVKVITFIPGSFIQSSNILAKQVENVYEMNTAFTPEQKRFYGDYFKRYNSYLSVISNQNPPIKIDDPHMYGMFERALMEISPKSNYLHETMKYTIYHTIFKYAPICIRDFFVVKFMQMPDYTPEQFIPDAIA